MTENVNAAAFAEMLKWGLEEAAPPDNGVQLRPDSGQAFSDFVTVVTARNGERLTKLIYRAGDEGLKTLAYDRAREFFYEQRPIASLQDLAAIIRGLHYSQAIIPGCG